MKRNKICLWLLPLVFVACGPSAQTREKQPVLVQTETVSTQAEDAEGTIYVGVVEENQTTIASYTSAGTLRRVAVSEGQAVSRGQLIAELDDTQARHMLGAAEAQSRQAEDALKRYQLLHDEGSMTEAQWVEVQSKVDQARSQLAIARRNVADCRLLAPVSGIVGKRFLSSGETAMPSEPVVSILDISSVKVKIAVPEREMKNLTPATATTVSVEATGREYPGGRIEKGVQADAMTHTYDVRVCVNNKDRELLPGMVAKVSVRNEGVRRESYIIPLTAVQKRAEGGLFVWTVGADSTVHRTPVTIGQTTGNRIEIQSGLAEGQRVVTEGYQKLSEGTKTRFQ